MCNNLVWWYTIEMEEEEAKRASARLMIWAAKEQGEGGSYLSRYISSRGRRVYVAWSNDDDAPNLQ